MTKPLTPPEVDTNFKRLTLHGEWGWRSGQGTRFPSIWLGFDFLTRRRMWIESVGSLLCSERFFPGYSGFPLSLKTSIRFDIL